MALFGRKTREDAALGAESAAMSSSPPQPTVVAPPALGAPSASFPGSAASADSASSAGGSIPAAPAGRHVAASTHDLVKVYGLGTTQVVALEGVNVEIYSGEFTAVMGPSGSGKSTLMHCMAGLDRITQGRVVIGGVDLSQLNDKALTTLRRDKVGFVFQAFNLIPTLSAQENILLPLSIAGRKPDQAWYDTVIAATGLQDRLSHKPSELSGGQQQRVACARALMSRPDIVFADEPTGNLDSRSGAEVLGFLRRSVDQFGQTVVMVTHDPTAAGYTDRVVFLADGHVVSELRQPTPERVLETMTSLDRLAAQAVLGQRPGA